MHRPFGFRFLIIVCIALAVLLAAVALVQYRWSKRVAAADAQREREHLETSAALFATQFNRAAIDAIEFLQNDVQSSLRSGARLTAVPKMISEIYLLDESGARPTVRVLNSSGIFTAVPQPKWMSAALCGNPVSEQPLSLISPVFDMIHGGDDRSPGIRVLRTFRGNRCLVGRLNESYLRKTLIPQLLQESFGDSSLREYDFAVVARDQPRNVFYGHLFTPDVERAFFAISPVGFPADAKGIARPEAGDGKNRFFIEHYQVRITTQGAAPAPFLFGDGIWQLRIAHRGIPLAAAFERERRRDLLFSVAAEVLLCAAIVLLVVGARRMQLAAEQKMQFVAAVSHELRGPISAISMLSRNQADGLVTGSDKVLQYGELIHQQSRRLSEMVEQTLQYAGIHSSLGSRAHAAIDLKSLLHDAIGARRDDLVRSGFEVDVDIPDGLPHVHGDANLLRIAIDNLVSNALKYAGDGRWIGIRAWHSDAEKSILIHVGDRGPGIAVADRERIFDPFCRGQAAIDAQIPGSGIGLSLVRSAAEAHGGAVTVMSEPGQGSTFTLRIPL